MMSTQMPKKSTQLTPAELVVARFGGVRKLGRMLHIDPSSISKWIARGGKIPNSSRPDGNDTHQGLLELAKKEGVKLTAEELIQGGRA